MNNLLSEKLIARRALNIPLTLVCLLSLVVFAAPATGSTPTAAGALTAAGPQANQPALGSGATRVLIVFAAASLMEPFTELGEQFEADHAGVKVIFNFAGSQQLRAQLEHGARADLFASANTREMDGAVTASLVVSGIQRVFAHNQLVVIFPKDNPGKLHTLGDLARPGLKLDVADKAVPAGQYTLDMLKKMSTDPAYGSGFQERVLANVVSRENNVKSVVSKVQLGEVDAGVVYATDVTGDSAASLGTLPIPAKYNQMAVYPIAPLAHSAQADLAEQFLQLVLSQRGQRVLAEFRFLPAQEQ